MKILLFSFIILIQLLLPAGVSSEKSFNRIRTFDVLHYKIGLRFDRSSKTVFGDSTITLKPLDKSLDSVELDAKDIKFSAVTQGSVDTALRYSVGPTKVTVYFQNPIRVGEETSIRFRYKAKPNKGIYFVASVRQKNRVVRAAQIWTQGEAEETSHWLPSYDFPDDKATTEQLITVNAAETVIGNGTLVSNTLNTNGTRTFHYTMAKPHSLYLTSFVVGKYAKISETYGEIPLNYFVYPSDKSRAVKAFGKTKDMMRVFEEKTGIKYPFSKYDQTIVARFPFGGMENITATTMADSEILNVQTKAGRESAINLVSHELAHSWFGNLVTCRNWAELWTNESFATFMEAVYREETNGRGDYIRKIREDASQYFAYTAVSDSAKHGLFNDTADPEDDLTMFDPVTYNKGSAIIHTLREEVGDRLFWLAINKYLTKFSYSNVETNDLKAVFEEVSERDLDWFFDQWVYRSGHPMIRVQPTFEQDKGKLSIKFSQQAINSNNRLDLYTLPLEITVTTSQKTYNETILLDKDSKTLVLDTPLAPTNIEIDKNYKIPIKAVSLSKLRTIK